ncbi:hypothetical protein TURU_029401 [Turdus rufiventris]|nr:hypothetical protein TURU_029401 [Turdus rufiventris]
MGPGLDQDETEKTRDRTRMGPDRGDTGQMEERDNGGTGQRREKDRTRTRAGRGRDREGPGSGQVRDRDRFGTGSGQVRDRDRFGTGSGQVVGAEFGPVLLQKPTADSEAVRQFPADKREIEEKPGKKMMVKLQDIISSKAPTC